MSDAEWLSEIKKALLITGDYQDNVLLIFIHEVKAFLKDAGVSNNVINSSASIGVVVRGVSDLWNYGSGGAELSPYFIQRAIQLATSTCE